MSEPTRLAKQIELLAHETRVVLVGAWARIVREASAGEWREMGSHRHPVSDELLRFRLLWNNPFVHASAMFRRESLVEAGGYRTDLALHYPEDYDLWSRLAMVGRLANVPELLVTYRQSPAGMSQSSSDRIRSGVVKIASRNLAAAAGVDAEDLTVIAVARTLNSVAMERCSPAEVARRIGLFRRAVSRTCPRGGLQLRAHEARWAAKLVIRSVRPASGAMS